LVTLTTHFFHWSPFAMPFKTLFLTFGFIWATLLSADASIIVLSHWQMGEELGDTDGRLDSVGGRHFSVSSGPVEFSGSVAPSATGSTVATNVRGNTGRAGFFGPNTTTFMPADNWGFEVWVRSENTTQNIDLFRVGGVTENGNLKIGQLGANWGASYHNISWIGASGGTGQPVVAEEWTHLAIVRDNGITSFYINGVAQAGTSTGAPVWGTSLHLGVMPGGGSGWTGDVDDARAFTFNPGEFNPAQDLLLATVVPEPNTLALLLLGLAPLLRRVGSHQR